jgi:hypothetical protein
VHILKYCRREEEKKKKSKEREVRRRFIRAVVGRLIEKMFLTAQKFRWQNTQFFFPRDLTSGTNGTGYQASRGWQSLMYVGLRQKKISQVMP